MILLGTFLVSYFFTLSSWKKSHGMRGDDQSLLTFHDYSAEMPYRHITMNLNFLFDHGFCLSGAVC